MTIQKSVMVCAAICCCAVAAWAQGTFQNLGFESATLVPIPGDAYGKVQFAPAFPGWTGSVGGVQQSAALYNNFFLDTSGNGIMDSGGPFLGGVIQGNYTALIQAGFGPGTFTPADTTLSQTGLVPSAAQSLLFRANLDPSYATFGVTLGGLPLSLFPLGGGTNYTLYGADIRALAGQTAELDFTVFAQRPHMDNYTLFLDSIQFSGTAIPEPGVLGLSALGAMLLGWRFWRKRR